MTKTRIVTILIVVAVALALVGGALVLWLSADRTVLHGTAVIGEDGNYILTSSDKLVWLNVEDDALLEGVQTGDMLAIVQKTEADGDAVVTDCIRLASGNEEAVAASPAVNAMKGERVSYSYGYAGVALNIPDGWCYAIKQYTEDNKSFGILFWPEGHGNSWNSYISVCYQPQFAVCGTGLQCKEAVIGGYQASIGTYGDINSEEWSFITFEGTAGTYVASTYRVFDWWETYGEQAMAILNTVTFAPDAPPMILEEEAIARADALRTVETYKNVYANFNHISGCWDVRYTNKHHRTIETVSVSALDIVIPKDWGPF